MIIQVGLQAWCACRMANSLCHVLFMFVHVHFNVYTCMCSVVCDNLLMCVINVFGALR